VRLIKAAWRAGYRDLAAARPSPGTPRCHRWTSNAHPGGDERRRPRGVFRAVTHQDGRRRNRHAVEADTAAAHSLPGDTAASCPAPIFYTKDGQPGPKGGPPRPPAPYTKDTLGDHFRELRIAVFGMAEAGGKGRKLMNFRRSGLVEALARGAAVETVAAKAANSIDQNRELEMDLLAQSGGYRAHR
jgi:hypothetical protein